MSDHEQLNKRRRINEEECSRQKNYWNYLVQKSNSLETAKLSETNKLSEILKEVNDLQIEKLQYDKQKYKIETEVVDIYWEYQNSETHLNALKERVELLDEITLEKLLKLEGDTVKDIMDRGFEYFNKNLDKLDEEINQQEAELAKRNESMSKMYEKICAKTKRAIKKQEVEYYKLSKTINLIGKHV